jgi:hypothetical protein
MYRKKTPWGKAITKITTKTKNHLRGRIENLRQIKRGGVSEEKQVCIHSLLDWFQASPAMLLRSMHFCDITRRRVVLVYRRFGTSYRSHIRGPRVWPVKMGPIRCPETSVNNYHTTPPNIPEDRRSQPPRCCTNCTSSQQSKHTYCSRRGTFHLYLTWFHSTIYRMARREFYT